MDFLNSAEELDPGRLEIALRLRDPEGFPSTSLVGSSEADVVGS
jgi:hypothetical protein